jgi:death-on-curing protein
MENISYHVAAGKISKELLHEILCATLSGNDENEELKLKIINAIKD